MTMATAAWHWLISSGGGLAVRIAAGAAILALLAIVDYRRRGRDATRWREYLFLLACTVGAIVYGVINDQITSTISWEYFYYGKELYEKLGPKTPPDPVALHLHAAVIGVMATWSAGLIVGVVLLVANNPTRTLPRLPYPQLLRFLPVIFGITALCAVVGGALGYAGCLSGLAADFRMLVRENLWRPPRFMAVWGIHLGGYIGAALSLPIAAALVIRKRRGLFAARGANQPG